MVEIKNWHVYNLEPAIVAAGNAMRVQPEQVTPETIAKAIGRCKKLSKLGGGSGHSNFRTGILVTFDLKYPQYFTKQVQRYHFLQYVSSTSMMHCLIKMNMDKCCNKYVTPKMKDLVNQMTEMYTYMFNNRDDEEVFSELKKDWMVLVSREYDYKTAHEIERLKTPDEVLYDCYMRILSNTPMGAELWVHCSTNYEQLATIYRQRRHHKLKEDWGTFCDWIESLPYAEDLICCGPINDEH